MTFFKLTVGMLLVALFGVWANPPPSTVVTTPSPGVLKRDSTERTPDTAFVAKSRADTVILIRHHFNHRQQIITGGVVMGCLIAVLAIMNNYNPR